MEDTNKIIMDTKATKIGGSVWVLIPSQIKPWIELEDGTELKIMTDEKTKGKYIAIWRK